MFDIEINGLNLLKEHIEYVKKLSNMKTDNGFQSYIRKKCLETVKTISRQRLSASTTTNEDMKSIYIENNKIREAENGFEIYNDLCIEKPDTHHSKGYTFCVALAFEYGTGIVGLGSTNAPSDYKYNVNDNKVMYDDSEHDGWWLSKEKNGSNPFTKESRSGKAVVTQGYEGMEIYRFSANKIEELMPKWVEEYYSKRGAKND